MKYNWTIGALVIIWCFTTLAVMTISVRYLEFLSERNIEVSVNSTDIKISSSPSWASVLPAYVTVNSTALSDSGYIDIGR